MKFKENVVIALLTGLLALSLFTQLSQNVGKSKEAKAVEYLVCLERNTTSYIKPSEGVTSLDDAIEECARHRP